MATPPRPTTPPPRPNPPSPPPPKPAANHERERKVEHEPEKREAPHVDDREKEPFDDPDMQTVQEEQLERSAEIEAMGVEAWKEAHDERNHPQPGRAVPGVSPTQKDDPGGRRA